jgi:hypothetical protein
MVSISNLFPTAEINIRVKKSMSREKINLI